MRKIALLAPAAALVLLPLMGAKGCSAQGSQPASTVGGEVVFRHEEEPVGKEFRLGPHTWWIGNSPPQPPAGSAWAPYGKTRLGRQIWIRVSG